MSVHGLAQEAADAYNAALKTYDLPLQLWNPGTGRVEMTAMPVLCPHEVANALYQKSPLIFRKCMLGDEDTDSIVEWWDSTLGEAWSRGHPALASPADFPQCIPVYLHYDGVESFRDQEAHVFSWGSVLGCGRVWERKFLMAVVHEVQVPTAELREAAFDEIMSCDGQAAQVAPSGTNGGDRVATVKLHKWHQWWHRTDMCELCHAQLPTLRADPALNYQWLSWESPVWARLRTQEEYEAETPVARLSPFRHIDGWGLGSDFEDLLHNVYLGHAKDALANAVYEVLCERPRHAWEPLMAEWDTEYRGYLRERGFQGAKILLKLKTFGIKPVGAPDFPEVSRRVKAAACKRLIPFIAAKVHQACDGSEHSRQRTM